jgi:RimJ/RimL family protein N-acetyltransferase
LSTADFAAGPRLQLRRFERGDFDRLIAEAASPEFLMQWSGGLFSYPLDRPQLERYLLTGIGDPPANRIFAAIDESGAVVGHIELSRIDRRNRAASLTRVLVFAAQRGRGLGSRLVQAALRVGFDELRLHRIELVVFDFNQAAVAAYRRAGLVLEGRLRDVRQVGEGYWSVYEMSMLEDEWRGRNAVQ